MIKLIIVLIIVIANSMYLILSSCKHDGALEEANIKLQCFSNESLWRTLEKHPDILNNIHESRCSRYMHIITTTISTLVIITIITL